MKMKKMKITKTKIQMSKLALRGVEIVTDNPKATDATENRVGESTDTRVTLACR